MKKTEKLSAILRSKNQSFFLEAHNALSARIVEEVGFEGIWASGLSIAASLMVRDNNEISWTQVLGLLEFMSDCTTIPILMDADTGYGNFNNVRRLVTKCEQRDIAGICIEDKIFPKSNSFRLSASQVLAPIEEFCGKIRAAKDTQKDPSFSVVARTEAFVIGATLTETLERCDAYAQAGADALLIHSKKATTEDIELFMSSWDRSVPVIIVPTTYANALSSQLLNELEITLVLWANHMLRASIWHMQKIASMIFERKNVKDVAMQIASIEEIFRLQDAEELSNAEKKYLTPHLGSKLKLQLAKGSSVIRQLAE